MIADPCCRACVSPHGICRTRYNCPHHVKADLQQRMQDNRKLTQYRDPTAEQAVARADRSRKRRKR